MQDTLRHHATSQRQAVTVLSCFYCGPAHYRRLSLFESFRVLPSSTLCGTVAMASDASGHESSDSSEFRGGGSKRSVDFLNEDDDDGTHHKLKVNDTFASKLNFVGRISAIQRVQQRNSRVPLPASMHAFLKKTLLEVRPSISRHADNAARAILQSYGFVLETGCPGSAAAEGSDVANDLGTNPRVKALLRNAGVYVKKHLFAAPESGGPKQGLKRPVAAAPPPSKVMRLDDAADVHHGSADRDTASSSLLAKRVVPTAALLQTVCATERDTNLKGTPALASGKGALPHTAVAALAVPTAPAVPRHVHGRGAGRGRGLSACGEPIFTEAHPSWQATRRVAARTAKAVTKSLRNGGAPIELVPASAGAGAGEECAEEGY